MLQAPRFFVSFSSRDLKYVREIMAVLKGQNIDFWDYSDIIQSIELGEKISDRLYHEIDNCTHILAITSKNTNNHEIGHWCRLEMEYALKSGFGVNGRFILVLIKEGEDLHLTYPYDEFEQTLYFDFNNTPESIVELTIRICKVLNHNYLPPIEAHPNLPFWKFFRKEVELFAQSNKDHVDLMKMLGEFNEYYKRDNSEEAMALISLFIDTCRYRVKKYQPFYPLLVRAVCETELGRLEDSMNSYSEAEQKEPMNQDVIGGKGTVFFKMNKFSEARKCFEQILDNPFEERKDNARINLIITKLAMGEEPSPQEIEFLFHLDISDFAPDLMTSVRDALGIYLRMKKDYPALERHCKSIILDDLHDTITIQLLCLSLFNRNLIWEAKEVLNNAINESKYNNRLNTTELEKFFKMLFN